MEFYRQKNVSTDMLLYKIKAKAHIEMITNKNI